MTLRDFAKELRAPMALAVAFLLLLVAERLGLIPSLENFVSIIRETLRQNGHWVVFFVSAFENCVIVNFVFPGAIAILAAMALTTGDLPLALKIFLFIWTGSALGLIASYWIGVTVNERKSDEGQSNIWISLVLSFWHPQLASMRCYALGAARFDARHLIVPAITINFFWNLFWGILTYNVGSIFNSASSIKFLVAGMLAIWIFMRMFNVYRRART